MIRFHLDENVNSTIARGLRQRGIDVSTTQEADLLGVSDIEQLAYAIREGRVIFTEDADFWSLQPARQSIAELLMLVKVCARLGKSCKHLN